MFSIYEISKEEDMMITRAHEQFGLLFDITLESIELSWQFVNYLDVKSWIFAGFLSQTNNCSYLSLLSLLRRHAAQSQFNLRLSIESSIMACYALYSPKIENFIYTNENGKLVESSSAKSKANKWIDKHYKSFSEMLHNQKKQINNVFAHSNLITAFGQYELSKENYQAYSWIFDRAKDTDIHYQLLNLLNLVKIQLELFKRIIEDYPIVNVIEDFDDRFDKINTIVSLLNDFYGNIAQEMAKGDEFEIPIFNELMISIERFTKHQR